jgi:hypothetical protein
MQCAGSNHERGRAAMMSMDVTHGWQWWGWAAMTSVSTGGGDSEGSDNKGVRWWRGQVWQQGWAVTTRAGGNNKGRWWWWGWAMGIIYMFNMIIPAFEFFYLLSCGLVIACCAKWNQTCGKSDIACFACRLSTFRACTGLYKCPQENCKNTDDCKYPSVQLSKRTDSNHMRTSKINSRMVSAGCRCVFMQTLSIDCSIGTYKSSLIVALHWWLPHSILGSSLLQCCVVHRWLFPTCCNRFYHAKWFISRYPSCSGMFALNNKQLW